jgi:hypothetical protein
VRALILEMEHVRILCQGCQSCALKVLIASAECVAWMPDYHSTTWHSSAFSQIELVSRLRHWYSADRSGKETSFEAVASNQDCQLPGPIQIGVGQ